jgi:hypothetical protein
MRSSRDLMRFLMAVGLIAAIIGYVRWRRDQIAHTPVARQPDCLNNLKQIGLALRIGAVGNGDDFVFNLSTNVGGTREFCCCGPGGFDSNTFYHFRAIASELQTPNLLVCPKDSGRRAAANFASLTTSNISYQLRTGTNLTPGKANEILMIGPVDGNILYCDGTVVDRKHGQRYEPTAPKPKPAASAKPEQRRKAKTRASDLSPDEQKKFAAEFSQKYQPAIQKWSASFAGHIPFSADAVTPDKLVDKD